MKKLCSEEDTVLKINQNGLVFQNHNNDWFETLERKSQKVERKKKIRHFSGDFEKKNVKRHDDVKLKKVFGRKKLQ